MPENDDIITEVEGLLAGEEGEPAPEPRRKQEQAAEHEVDETPTHGYPDQKGEEDGEQAEQEPTKSGEVEESAEGEQEQIAATLGEFAEYLREQGADIDVADLYQLTLPVTTPDGKKEITIGQWKDGFQAAAAAQHAAEKAKAEMQEAMNNVRAQAQMVQQRLQELDGLAGMDEQAIRQEAQKVDWEELRANDPAEYAAKRREFDERFQAIQHRRQWLAGQHQQQQQRFAHERNVRQQQLKVQEEAALLQAIPAWQDTKVAEAEKTQLVEYLKGRGYRPEEISNIYDHRAVGLMLKAMKFDAQSAAKPELKKVVKIGSKVLKPGSSRSKSQIQGSAFREGLQKFRKGGGRNESQAVDLVEKYLLEDM